MTTLSKMPFPLLESGSHLPESNTCRDEARGSHATEHVTLSLLSTHSVNVWLQTGLKILPPCVL